MKPHCIWLTGLPCSGKTTIAKELLKHYKNATLLDGDIIRNTFLGQDVGFSPEDRRKHLLRMGTIAKLMVDSGLTVICSFVSPDFLVRKEIREMFGNQGNFYEIYVSTPLEVCEQRDVKGMYAKARAGEIKDFTGVSAPYNPGHEYELRIDTTNCTVQEAVDGILTIPRLNPYDERKAMFIGRWNGVFHNGHDYIIQSKLKEGKKVLMCVRDVCPDEGNPWTAKQVKEMLEYRWRNNSNVEVTIIPDIASVEYGRGVGYEVNEIKVDKEIAGISGTKLREMMSQGDASWKTFVPQEIVEYFEKG